MADTGQVRAQAARIVAAVARDGRSLDEALARIAGGSPQRPAVQSIAFGTIRWLPELEACLRELSARPPEQLDTEVRALLLVGLFQLAHGETPPHAAVSETVEAARLLRQARAAGFINAVLRRFQRERDSTLAAVHRDPVARYAHPAWLVEALQRDWAAEAESLMSANNDRAPMWLRVNARRTDRAAYADRLAAQGITPAACAFAPEALRLPQPLPVDELPGFADGEASVQDVAAQLAAHLLGARPGMRVLDACAAPGGKTCHVLELEPALRGLVALELDPARAALVSDNLERLGLEAEVMVGDAGDAAGWWDGQPFQRILLDAPCSGSGVIRRHPDIKVLRRAADIPAIAVRQRGLLDSTWALLEPGGRLLYATCSVLRAENSDVVRGFLLDHPEAAEVTESARLFLPAPLPGAGPEPGFVLPTAVAGNDGFYYACIEKRV